MTPLKPSPELDARIGRWMGESHMALRQTYSRSENGMGRVLDRLVEKGYEPVLYYNKARKTWTLGFVQGIDGPEQPTRPLAVAAAIVALMEESEG